MIRWEIIENDLQQLLSSNRDASVALRNFLLNQRTNITAGVLNDFILKALDYPHWQQQRETLSAEIKSFLVAIGCEDYAKEIFWPEDIQIVNIEKPEDHVDCIKHFLKSRYRGSEMKVIPGPQGHILGIVKNSEGFTVHQFSNRFWVCQGQLVPVKQDLQLVYDLDLNLKSAVPQGLEVATHVSAHFQVEAARVNGFITRGYLFQRIFELKDATYYSYPKLLFALKSLEQNYIDKESDPFYTDLIGSLERSIRLLQKGDTQILQEIHETIAFAQSLREFVFPDDKILEILLKEVRNLTAQKSSDEGTKYGANSIEQGYRRQRPDFTT